ncbi:DUF6056 family protein [Ralstonia mannitolilytica]|uniref:DUF6056 family protein n=1 Tax=Ralstonia mannitolilytica TaxID=105219 RepID=UPI00292D0615|nr:DUF6056 family protein [Ralstonia mannitolilytica]
MLAALAAGLIWLNGKMPLWSDDYHRANASFASALLSSGSEYMHWTGRIFVTFATYLSLSGPVAEAVFNVMNALMFVALLLAAFAAARRRLPTSLDDAIYVALFLCAIWLGSEAIAESVLWKTGSIGYLWVVTANLVVAYFLIEKGSNTPPLWMYPVAVFAGNGLEHVTITMIALTLFQLLYSNEKVGRGQARVLAAYAVGCILLLGAPGNFARLGVATSHVPLATKLGDFLQDFTGHYLHTPFLWVFLVSLAMHIISGAQREVMRRAAFFVLLGIGSAAIMAPLPLGSFSGRISFASDIFVLVGALALAPQMSRSKLAELTIIVSFTVAIAILGIDVSRLFTDYRGIADQVAKREAFIVLAKERGATEVTLPAITLESNGQKLYGVTKVGRYYVGDVGNEITDWTSVLFKEYYGISAKMGAELAYK